jgi:uncharacterized protein with gpF-like domain
MPYTPDDLTDKELEALEKRIAEVFKQAEKDLDKEVKEYFAKFVLRDKEMQQLANAGEITQQELQMWRLTQMGRGERFEKLRDKVAERYTKANEVAIAYVNDATPSIYSLNRNYEAYTIEKAVGSCDFTMWDESTVRRLLVEQPDVMPFYPEVLAVRRGIDLEYGKSQITKHVTSGIIRGLPPGKIANELMASMTGMNRASAVRAARTGITAAQNAGRMDSYVAAEKMGIQIKRRWVCTKDSRTRLDHALADGQIVVGTKIAFKVGGYKMKFPGDRSLGAPGHQLYNCRCTIRTVEKDGIEAEPRQMRVANPKWEEAKAEETKLEKKLERLKEREQAETDPEKRKQLRRDRITTQNELKEATKKRQGLDKNVVVNEMTYPEWEKWKKSLVNSGNGATITVGTSVIKKPKKSTDANYNRLLAGLNAFDVEYNPVINHASKLTESEIISALAGGDMTKGSCASVGLAYIGQKLGWNVLDFRDGESRRMFSGSSFLKTLSEMNGMKAFTAQGASSMTVANRLLKMVEPGKEYYLAVGRHAAIVRKNDAGVLQYLELQSKNRSGWTDFDGNPRYTLKTRFGCTQKSSAAADYDFMLDITESDFTSSDDFRSLLGFLNTEENAQRKGQHGTIK